MQQLASFKERKYEFFDRSITPKSAKKIGSDIYYFIWNWFLDDSGKDISKIDGCSLGLAFVPSLEILLNTVLRYHTGLSNILNAHNHIYFSSQVESVFIEVIKDLHQSIGFECSIVESKIKSIANKSGKNQQVYDASYRKRDLSPLFNPESLKFRLLHKIIYYLTNIFQSVSTKHPRVVIMSAGKDEDYLEHIKSNYPKAFRWVVPVTWKTKVLSLVSVKKKGVSVLFFHILYRL